MGDNDRAMTNRQLGWRAGALAGVVAAALLLRATVFAPSVIPVRVAVVLAAKMSEPPEGSV